MKLAPDGPVRTVTAALERATMNARARPANLQDPSATGKRTQALLQHLFDDPSLGTWAVLDGASVQGLVRAIATHGVQSACLLAGKLHPSMACVAPYLVALEESSSFTSWLLETGWGRHWGVFLRSRSDLESLRKHLRRFLLVKDPEGKRLHFRYYDPRVLELYLPTCTPRELDAVFGNIVVFLMEMSAGAKLASFTRIGSELHREDFDLGVVSHPATR